MIAPKDEVKKVKKARLAVVANLAACRSQVRYIERHGLHYVTGSYQDIEGDIESQAQKAHLAALLRQLYLATQVMIEAANLPLLRAEFYEEFKGQESKLSELESPDEDPEITYSPALTMITRYIEAVGALADDDAEETVDAIAIVENLLEQTPHILHARNVTPTCEADVHKVMLDIFETVFSSTINKPSIAQTLKHYEPDVGIPELGIAIEFKFATDKNSVKNDVDQIYADMHGYSGDPSYDRFYAVIYTTEPLYTTAKVLKQWEVTKADVRWKPLMVHGTGDNKKTKKK